MKQFFWLLVLSLLLALPALAQSSLAGTWQGVEDADSARYYPAVMRLQRGVGDQLFGILYQEVGKRPGINVTFQMAGPRTATGLKLNHLRKLDEQGSSPFSYWCDGFVTFTYNAAQEKLTGRAIYDPVGNCDTGEFSFYRVVLKSAATVKAGALSTLRVSGRDVRWYADAAHTKLLAAGNVYATKLTKTTTFYLTQGFFPSAQSQAVPITVATTTAKIPTAPKPAGRAATPAIAAARPRATRPLPAPDAGRVPPPPPVLLTLPNAGAAPLVLPTVLFKQSTPVLLPSAYHALDALAAELKTQPTVRLRIVGHTDHLPQDDATKNQQLSEDRAAAVKAYLVKEGIAADRLETAGYGDTKRLYPSPDIRNRRVEVERL